MNDNTCNTDSFFSEGRGRSVLRTFLHLIVSAAILFLILLLIPQLGEIRGLLSAVGVIVILSMIQIFIWPVFIRVFLGIFYKISPAVMFIAFPLLSLVLLTLFIIAGSWLSSDFVISGFGSAFAIAVLLTVISVIFASIFTADDELLIYQRTLKRIGRKAIKDEDMGKPGLIFLEIDGLGRRVLQEAMERGMAPNLRRWMQSGSHKLASWTSDLSSQTSAAQAGILHGNNFNIPAFRWYDKAEKKIIVSSSMNDVSQLEKKLSDGNGLLCNGGTARASLFSGDASHVLMVASRPFDMTSADLKFYYLNPSSLVRSLSLTIWDWVLEKKSAWGQWIRNEQPRVKRSGIYFILRSMMTVFIRDFSLFTLKGDMYSGVPYIYITLAGYDEVAHHSGIESTDALGVLRKLDKEFGRLEKIALNTPRKYKFVVLSDHGQTQGRTFAARYGETLEDLINRLVNKEEKNYAVTGYETRHESAYYLGAAFKDWGISDSGIGRRVSGVLDNSQQVKVGRGDKDDIVVLASGNLGLVSFSSVDHRMTFEEIAGIFPGLFPGLIEHPGIGLVMVRSSRNGPVVLGRKGRVFLDSGYIEGENPLDEYGPHAASVLSREDSFPGAPDVLVISTYWNETREVAAFEDLIGSHGGIGGDQSEPFILYPCEFDLGSENILGAEAIHHVLKNWISEIINGKIE